MGLKLTEDIASVTLSGACKLGSAVGQTACSVISAAAAQIKMAIKTGNNDWANCLGTTQMGACVGDQLENWMNGTQSGDAGAGVETAQTVQDTSGNNVRQQRFCWCDRNCYQNDGYFTDTKFMHQYDYSVVSDETNGAGQRECANHMKTIWPYPTQLRNGYKVYYQYTNCEIVTVQQNDPNASMMPLDQPATIFYNGQWQQFDGPSSSVCGM